MTPRQREILNATEAASHVAAEFPSGRRTSFDIVSTVKSLEIPFMFRPLKGLWGAAITVGEDTRGILVTSKLDMHVQRFTLAHELGHLILGHKLSFDETVGLAHKYGDSKRPPAEIGADTFASELLASKSRLRDIAKRHRWTREALTNPANVYQLSLRLGVSYLATCWALVAQEVLTNPRVAQLREIRVKDIKETTAPSNLITNSWADVWSLSKDDSNTEVEAGPDDLFAVHVQENSSAGFLWELIESPSDFEVISDSRNITVDGYGQPYSRVIYLRFKAPGIHKLSFSHRRPWNKETVESIHFHVDGVGKERGGFARSVRTDAVLAGVE